MPSFYSPRVQDILPIESLSIEPIEFSQQTPNKLHVLQNVLPDTHCARRYMDTRHSEFGFITAIHLHATSTKHPLTTSECCIFVSGLLATS